jgi:hypothetical protein
MLHCDLKILGGQDHQRDLYKKDFYGCLEGELVH